VREKLRDLCEGVKVVECNSLSACSRDGRIGAGGMVSIKRKSSLISPKELHIRESDKRGVKFSLSR